MLSIFQLRIRDLLWLMLVCAIVALFIRRYDRTVCIDRVERIATYIEDDSGASTLAEVRYRIQINDLELTYQVPEERLPPQMKPHLDRISGETIIETIHRAPLPAPPGQASP